MNEMNIGWLTNRVYRAETISCKCVSPYVVFHKIETEMYERVGDDEFH